MTDNNKTIPVWVDNDGVKTQVGWATPNDGTGVRKINLLDGFDNTALKNVRFGDIDPFETELNPAETQEPEEEIDPLLDEYGFEVWTQEDADALDDDSDETEDLPEGFEPAAAVQEEPEQSEDPAQP